MLNTLHISHIDDSVMLALRHRAQEMHVSVEELVRRRLKEIGAGNAETNGNTKQEKFIARFPEFGTWSEEDLQEFERNTAPLQEKNAVLEKLRGTWTEEDLREFEHNTAPLREIDP